MKVQPSVSLPPDTADELDRGSAARQCLSIVQGLFYVVTGVWPLVSIGSFQRVTGPKTDLWLVKTAGVLISVIGGVMLVAGLRRRVTPEVAVLGTGTAAGLTAIDVVYVARRRISPVYLLDALAEVVLIAAWLFVGIRGPRRLGGRDPVGGDSPTRAGSGGPQG